MTPALSDLELAEAVGLESMKAAQREMRRALHRERSRNMRQLKILLDEAHGARLDNYAQRLGLTRSNAICNLIDQFL